MRAARAAGLSRAQLEEVLAVAWCFNIINRLADAFTFRVGSNAEFAASARMLLTRGYRL